MLLYSLHDLDHCKKGSLKYFSQKEKKDKWKVLWGTSNSASFRTALIFIVFFFFLHLTEFSYLLISLHTKCA